MRIDAFGASGNRLESAQISTVAVTAWNLDFLGIESTAGIRRMVFSGVDFGIDGLMIEPNSSISPVPEPSTAVLVLGGLIALSATGRRAGSASQPPG